jgi:hypothetical protein
VLYCLSGVGRICIGRDAQPQAIYPGDTVLIPPDTLHWHGAAPDRRFAHLAMSESGEQGQGTQWGEHVSDPDYRKEPARWGAEPEIRHISRGGQGTSPRTSGFRLL